MEEDGWMACRPWWQGWVVGPALGMARTGWHPRCFRTALVCGWWWDPVLVFLVAWLCPGTFWSPDGACAPVLWPLPCMLAGPSLPLLAFPPCFVHVTACVPFSWLGMNWPHFMWVSSPGL